MYVSYLALAVRLSGAAGATHCDNFDEFIPAARRKIVAGCRLCVTYQAGQESLTPSLHPDKAFRLPPPPGSRAEGVTC